MVTCTEGKRSGSPSVNSSTAVIFLFVMTLSPQSMSNVSLNKSDCAYPAQPGWKLRSQFPLQIVVWRTKPSLDAKITVALSP